ncbi:MAG: histidinol dehydrogenase [Chloroflexi bacterium]|nr:histidinol dehydrogenase [Chloroflexota bacterium]
MTIRILSRNEAADTILRRRPLGEAPLPSAVRASIRRVFGADLSAEQVVDEVVNRVQESGDRALLELTDQIDGVQLPSIEVPKEAISSAYAQVDGRVVDALRLAARRIESFHRKSIPQSWMDLSEEGVLGQMIRPLERVGLYSPGGTADYPSTILMQAIPARAAGVKEVVLASPPRQNGIPSPLTLLASDIARVDRVFSVGGAQAIAALAFGTETIPRVDKILGPGNVFVALAKRRVYGAVGIDQLAGPTETVIVADESASPDFVAADMLAQAEHDPMASAILITNSRSLAEKVNGKIADQLTRLTRAATAKESLRENGGAVVVGSVEEAIELANEYAPEHLCLLVENGLSYLGNVKNAGGVFVGEYSPEVVGDYVAGPSHVMPTGGTARFSSPVNVLDFIKVTSIVALNREATLAIGPAAETIAAAEGLSAHARAMHARLHEDAQGKAG